MKTENLSKPYELEASRIGLYFINEPSTLQPDHQWHGLEVFAPRDLSGLQVVTVLFRDNGLIASARIETRFLSERHL